MSIILVHSPFYWKPAASTDAPPSTASGQSRAIDMVYRNQINGGGSGYTYREMKLRTVGELESAISLAVNCPMNRVGSAQTPGVVDHSLDRV